MKVGLTGGQGFIGSWVRRELLKQGHDVVVFDRYPRTKMTKGEDFFLGDIQDPTAVTELAAHVDGIIHLAAVLGTQETIQNPRPSAATNILGGLNVLEAAVQYGLPAVYAGVGNAWMRDHATGSYTISKTCVEDYARMYNAYRGGKISVVRPVNAYGPGQSAAAPYGPSKVRKILPAFACRALTGTAIEVYGDGSQVSDCIYVEDVARTFVAALEWTASNGRGLENPAEVGPVDSCTVNAIARLVAQAAATATGREPVEVSHLPMRPGEVPGAVVRADTTTLEPLGIDPEQFVALEQGIGQTVDWFASTWLPHWEG
ncbi:NAD-dependent epimerase/dehydratase family protein [Streptomyces sp. NEAU-Y11]|uniref:NAD-dependent epimerase/dehydratase family protein n=1 Tax=Streptomyces cucumeris TaxID=2962890 RepID=UPI0020C8B3AB|nr:NAD-dependent epimerase/dehydratase family protein [Streptomyces sp. NEAU-Y11]MCP9209653.1 NAD-dependent epimerase/dehydratase family protein [Streptomyces sp. NEAU-Y11]